MIQKVMNKADLNNKKNLNMKSKASRKGKKKSHQKKEGENLTKISAYKRQNQF